MKRLALLLALAASPAAATLTGSGTVDFTFTGFHGPFALSDPAYLGDPAHFYPGVGELNGATPVYNGEHLGALINGALPLSGQSVAFAITYRFPGATFNEAVNTLTFTPIASFTNQPRGVPFKIGTFTFTNGSWYGGFANVLNNIPSFFDFTLTTHSATPEFNQVINDSFKMTVNVADCSLPGGADDQADFISIEGAPQLGSFRVYDSGGAGGACTPAGFTNTGSIDLFVKFNSLDYVGLRNPQGGFFSPSVAPGPLGGVPEPASWVLLIAGFGLTGAAMRRRSRLAIVAA